MDLSIGVVQRSPLCKVPLNCIILWERTQVGSSEIISHKTLFSVSALLYNFTGSQAHKVELLLDFSILVILAHLDHFLGFALRASWTCSRYKVVY